MRNGEGSLWDKKCLREKVNKYINKRGGFRVKSSNVLVIPVNWLYMDG